MFLGLKNLILLGVNSTNNKRLNQKIILGNSIAMTIISLMVFFSFFYLDQPLITVFYLGSIPIYGLVLLLNAKGKFNFSRIYFILSATIGTLLISGMLSDEAKVPQKFAIISTVILPVLLFGIEEKLKMLFGVLWIIFIFLIFDFVTPIIPNISGIEVFEVKTNLLIIINGLVSIVMFTLGYWFLMRIIVKNEQELNYQKELLERKNQQILSFNKSLEDQLEERTLNLQNTNIELNKKVEAIREVAFRNSHIYRQPISNIIGLIDLLNKKDDDTDINSIYELLKQEAEKLDKISRDNNEILTK